MKLTIRSVVVGDDLTPIRRWQADNPVDVLEALLIDIGPKGAKSADAFSMRVATPAGLVRADERNGIVATRALLVMKRYDFDVFWTWLESTVASCEGEDWKDCVANLRRHFDWEYDGYKER